MPVHHWGFPMIREDPASLYLEDAIAALHHSVAAERSFTRRACCITAAQSLCLAGLPGRALALAESFYGDGRGVPRLYDDLCTLANQGKSA